MKNKTSWNIQLPKLSTGLRLSIGLVFLLTMSLLTPVYSSDGLTINADQLCANRGTVSFPSDRLEPGRWWNPDRSGHGWDFFFYVNEGANPNDPLNQKLFVTFYTYDSNGKPIWYGAVGNYVNDDLNGLAGWLGELRQFTKLDGYFSNLNVPGGTVSQGRRVASLEIAFHSSDPRRSAVKYVFPDQTGDGADEEIVECLISFEEIAGDGFSPISQFSGTWVHQNSSGMSLNSAIWGIPGVPVAGFPTPNDRTIEHHTLVYFSDESTDTSISELPRWVFGQTDLKDNATGGVTVGETFVPMYYTVGSPPWLPGSTTTEAAPRSGGGNQGYLVRTYDENNQIGSLYGDIGDPFNADSNVFNLPVNNQANLIKRTNINKISLDQASDNCTVKSVNDLSCNLLVHWYVNGPFSDAAVFRRDADTNALVRVNTNQRSIEAGSLLPINSNTRVTFELWSTQEGPFSSSSELLSKTGIAFANEPCWCSPNPDPKCQPQVQLPSLPQTVTPDLMNPANLPDTVFQFSHDGIDTLEYAINVVNNESPDHLGSFPQRSFLATPGVSSFTYIDLNQYVVDYLATHNWSLAARNSCGTVASNIKDFIFDTEAAIDSIEPAGSCSLGNDCDSVVVNYHSNQLSTLYHCEPNSFNCDPTPISLSLGGTVSAPAPELSTPGLHAYELRVGEDDTGMLLSAQSYFADDGSSADQFTGSFPVEQCILPDNCDSVTISWSSSQVVSIYECNGDCRDEENLTFLQTTTGIGSLTTSFSSPESLSYYMFTNTQLDARPLTVKPVGNYISPIFGAINGEQLLDVIAYRVIDGRDNQIVTYMHTDALGSIVASSSSADPVDQSAEFIYKEQYTPFGKRRLNETASEQDSLFFTGKEEDSTGLNYFGARYYDPEIGRFLSVDPVGFVDGNVQSLNRYAYGNNSPFVYVDVDGRSATVTGGAIGCVVTALACPAGATVGATVGLIVDVSLLIGATVLVHVLTDGIVHNESSDADETNDSSSGNSIDEFVGGLDNKSDKDEKKGKTKKSKVRNFKPGESAEGAFDDFPGELGENGVKIAKDGSTAHLHTSTSTGEKTLTIKRPSELKQRKFREL